MGIKSGDEPNVEQCFLERICHALDLTPWELAKSIGVSYTEDIKPLLALRCTVESTLEGETWWKISAFISKRVGQLLAAKAEMNRAVQKDRRKVIARRERQKAYHAKNIQT